MMNPKGINIEYLEISLASKMKSNLIYSLKKKIESSNIVGEKQYLL